MAGGGENDERERERERESREQREGDKVDLSPNHGWCVSEEEPKGTKISPRVTCTCFELHIHWWSTQIDDELY